MNLVDCEDGWILFVGLFFLDVCIIVIFGLLLDFFGNFVNEDGDSLDFKGCVIDLECYLMVDGVIYKDVVRDWVYIEILVIEFC